MKKKLKKLLGVLLCLTLVLGMMPGMSLTVYADTVASGNCGASTNEGGEASVIM